MNIQNEPWYPERYCTDFCYATDIEGFEYRIAAQPIAILKCIIERDGPTVAQNEINMSGRNTDGTQKIIYVL
jgi:hypothetical protein